MCLNYIDIVYIQNQVIQQKILLKKGIGIYPTIEI